ncbi:MAG: hypothetical protein K2X77_25410 [Candidatus Obscuribacterales bacterium]|jgi:hypothetical protein|nr:hypothetical protein [Candidatus Obscuribacterales bacterium]
MSVHWSLKWSIFAASVVSLSWFFAGWRQVNQAGGFGDWALLLGGTASTICLLGVQGYWIYFEEKNKGRLTKRIALFESIHEKLEAGRSVKIEPANSESEGSSNQQNSKIQISEKADTAKKEGE